MNKLKTFGIIFAILISLVFLAMDAWWITIYKYAPDKVTSNTFNLSSLTTADGSVTKNFVEVNYMRNDNQQGLELFEVKFNYFTDEGHENLFSQGLQFVGNTETDKLSWTYYKDESQTKGIYLNGTSGWYAADNNYGYWGGYKTNEEATTIFNYQSSNDYATTLVSTNELLNNSRFKVTIGEDNFLMSFKNRNAEMTPENFQYKEKGRYHFYVVYGRQDMKFYYSAYDVNYFAYLLYNAVCSLPAGTNETALFEFGDIFDYYKETDTPNVYEEIAVDKANCPKIISDIKSYYGIKVNVVSDGVKKASESMFNCVAGNSNFNLTGDYSDDTYFYGRSMIDVNIYDFELVKVEEIYFALKLKQEFLDEYLQYRNKIRLNIVIDTTVDEVKDLTYLGFTADSGLDNFIIENTQILTAEVENV